MGFSLVGPGGASVAAGKLLGLGAAGIQNALGVALPLGGGSLRGCGYMTHVHEAGVPARIGVWAAVLVSRGFTGCPDYLDGAFSWGEQFASGGRGYHAGELTANLGSGKFFLETSGAAPKLYGSCGLTHLAIEGLSDLMSEHDLKGDDVASVDLIVPAFADRVASFKEPTNGEEAKFSIRQAAAGVLVDGVPELPYIKPFTDAGAEDPRYVEARRRVRLALNEEAGNVRGFAAQTVTITLNDGRQLTKTVEGNQVRGREAAPLTDDERIDMFFHTVEGVVDRPAAARIVDLVMECEGRPMAELADAISGS
jgi:2-methylcitrate dehydratase PrpD